MKDNTHKTHWIGFLAVVAGILSVTLGIIVLAGWYTHTVALIQVHASFVPMQYNTAMGFFLSGLGLLAFAFKRTGLAIIGGGVVATIGSLTLVEYIFGLDLGIDQLLMEHYVLVKTSHPGRMAPNTALCFFLTGSAILSFGILVSRHHFLGRLIMGSLGLIILGLGVIAFTGYIVDLESAYGWGHLTRMAVHTSLGFIVLGIGLSIFAVSEKSSEGWQTGNRMKIARRLLIIFLLIALLPLGLISVVGLSSSKHLLEETTGSNFKSIAFEKTRAIDYILEAKIKEAKTLASHPFVIEAVSKANTAYSGMLETQIREMIGKIDEEWIDSGKDSSVVQRILGNELSSFLNKYRKTAPIQYADLFITDRYGTTIATTEMLSDYYQADEEWWQASFNKGKGALFIDDRGFDESVQTIVLGITVPVANDGKVIGILKIHFKLDNILSIISGINLDEDEAVYLMRSQGTLIASSPGWHHNEEELNSYFEIAVAANGQGWSNGLYHGKETFIGFASVAMPFFTRIPSPGARKGISGEKWAPTTWYIFVETMQATASSAINKLIMIFLVVGLITSVVVIFVALITAKSVSLPILTLQEGVEKISKGDLSYRVGTDDNDEIAQLSRAFDMMLDRLNTTMASRDELNKEITVRKQAEEKLQLAASVFTHAREGIIITDTDGTIIDVNEAFTQITGYSHDKAIGQNPRILKSERQGPEFYTTLWHNLIKNGHWYGEIWNRRKSGEVYPEMLTISAVRNAQGETLHYVALFADITEQKAHQNQLEHIAHYDALTNLPNRLLLADRLHQSIVNAERNKHQLAVAYLDLDGFKEINDTHGHKVGDQLLMTVSTRMKKSLRKVDTIARLGGDEFVAVLNNLDDTKASLPMLTRLLAAAAKPVHIDDHILQVSASIGVTFYPQGEPIDADQLLRQADQSMYQAKMAGKNRYHIFDTELDRNVRGHHESLENIRHAMNNREFVLYYQPKVNMRSGELVGTEALIRWQHPEQGLLSPIVFLPVIEAHPLAIELGEWVIDTALAQLGAWRTVGLNLSVSVNISAFHMQQNDFTDRLLKILTAHPDIKPNLLELEVLETSALEDIERMSQMMHRCGELGVRFALDDFGTGYSSLTYLKRLPARHLKIDQSFVRDMLDDPEDLAIVEGVLGLAQAFRRQPIAEGVETVEHGELLLQLGCELAQGYGIARPMPADELQGWFDTWQPDPRWTNQHPVGRDNLPLLFASIEHRAWVRGIEEFFKGERTMPASQDYHHCRFGKWLDNEGQARYFAHPSIQPIESLHRQVHALAEELLELQNHDQAPDEVQAKLGQLHGLRDALLGHLKVLLQES
jgi:diguanylate cyclase (GGDEF)-like protein/PAS domain S-box-containing protein